MIVDHFNLQASIVFYHGDANDLIDTIPDEYVKLIITSPPYNLNKSYETRLTLEQYLKQQEQTIAKLHKDCIKLCYSSWRVAKEC